MCEENNDVVWYTIKTEDGILLCLTEEELDNYIKNKDREITEEEKRAFAEGLAKYMKVRSNSRKREKNESK